LLRFHEICNGTGIDSAIIARCQKCGGTGKRLFPQDKPKLARHVMAEEKPAGILLAVGLANKVTVLAK
jgi:hypothetical protein